ncbi:MAG: saccharopine dehydrogenase NADP-binding domain-containing protein, partial [Gemmatimonadales bacterium]|nr:saccharopine dehydrogenase NADP-binding domain-containing protein [Gemmatimonadales bacterium]
MRGVAVLGSTGSIGCSTLAVLRRHPDRFRLIALTGGANGARLAEQTREWEPRYSALAVDDGRGASCLIEAACRPDVDIVVNAVVGFAGLEATLAALRAGKRVALANKESLVAAGEL